MKGGVWWYEEGSVGGMRRGVWVIQVQVQVLCLIFVQRLCFSTDRERGQCISRCHGGGGGE